MTAEGPDEGDRVIKEGGDYTFEGVIVAVFRKKSGERRYVVEDARGILMIMNSAQIRVIESEGRSILRTQVERDLARYTALPKYKSPERDAALQALIESVEALSELEREVGI